MKALATMDSVRTFTDLPADLQPLLDGVRSGNRLALARAISHVENERPGFEAFLHTLLTDRDEVGGGARIGFTGPPGAGKSSLVTAMSRTLLERGDTVGVVAVDPTSPYSGGALLGDRIRMNELATNPGIFIRSMASRGSLGGLATTTTEVLDVMDAFGFPRLLIETVGVGQTELEVAGAADTVVVVLVPESGDGIQAMKAGLMEIADVFVVNKADRPGADRLVKEIRTAIHFRAGPGSGGGAPAPAGHHGVDLRSVAREVAETAATPPSTTASGSSMAATPSPSEPDLWTPPVLQTMAHAGEGVDDVLAAIEAHRAWLLRSGTLAERRRARTATRIRDVMERALRRQVRALLSGRTPEGNRPLVEGLEAIEGRTGTPYSVAEGLLQRFRGGGERLKSTAVLLGWTAAWVSGFTAMGLGALGFGALGLGPQPLEARQLTPIPLDTLPVLGSRVSADLPLRTRSVQILTRDVLRTLPARTVGEALQWATGVEFSPRSPAQADLSIRGAGFEPVLVLVDGVRASDPQTGHFDLDLAVPLDRVERIEILRGPASAQYGSDAVGGVVNIVTRGGMPISVRAEAGSWATRILALQGGLGRSDGLGLHLSFEDGTSDGHRIGTEWAQRLGTGRLTLPIAGGLLRGEVGAARREFGAKDFYAPFPSVETTATRTAGLAWVPGAGAQWRIEPRISWRAHDDDFILIRGRPEVYRNEHQSEQLGGEVALRGRPIPWLRTALGVEGWRDRLESRALGDQNEDRVGLFVEGVVSTLGGVDLSAGLRHDDHTVWGGFTSPSVAAGIEVTPNVRLRGSLGRSFRGPSWTERFYADPGHVPNPNLQPEVSRAEELGASIRSDPQAVGGAARVEVSLFRRTSRDLIDWARPATPAGGAPAPWVPRNVQEARVVGLEFDAAWESLAGSTVSFGGAFLTLDAETEPGFESKYALRPLTEQWNLGILHPLPGGVRIAVRGRRGKRSDEAAFHEVDTRLESGLPLASGARLHVDLRNVTGARHLDLTGNAVAGRALFVGVQWELRP